MRPITARDKRRDSRGPSTKHYCGGVRRCRCTGCTEERLGKPTLSASFAIAEGWRAMAVDEVDDEATEDLKARVEFARAMLRTTLTRAEAAWIGDRILFDADHYDAHADCEYCDGKRTKRFLDLLPLEPQHRARERYAERVIVRVTQDVAEGAPAMGTTVVLDDPDEMLSDEVVWDHAWDLVDYQGV